jgi:hypothetical protein
LRFTLLPVKARLSDPTCCTAREAGRGSDSFAGRARQDMSRKDVTETHSPLRSGAGPEAARSTMFMYHMFTFSGYDSCHSDVVTMRFSCVARLG